MVSKHTPGPWRIGGKEKRVIFAANGDVVARTAAYGSQSETPEAESGNAALIAAAPALLAALQMLTRGYGVTFHDQALRFVAQEAIAAATQSEGVPA